MEVYVQYVKYYILCIADVFDFTQVVFLYNLYLILLLLNAPLHSVAVPLKP